MRVLGDAHAQALRPVLGDPLDERAEPARSRGALSTPRGQFPAAAAGELSSGHLARPVVLRRRAGARRLVDLLLGEARLGGVAAYDRLALLVGEHLVDIVEAV